MENIVGVPLLFWSNCHDNGDCSCARGSCSCQVFEQPALQMPESAGGIVYPVCRGVMPALIVSARAINPRAKAVTCVRSSAVIWLSHALVAPGPGFGQATVSEVFLEVAALAAGDDHHRGTVLVLTFACQFVH